MTGTDLQGFVLGGSSLLQSRPASVAWERQEKQVGCSGDPIPDPKPKLVPRAAWTAVGQLELVLSAAELCVSLSRQAGDDSQPSQVSLAWREEMVSGDGNAVKSSSFSGKQPCPLPAGVTSSARHAFPSPVLSSALQLEVASQVWSRWLPFVRHRAQQSTRGDRGQEQLGWAPAATVIP